MKDDPIKKVDVDTSTFFILAEARRTLTVSVTILALRKRFRSFP